MHADNTITPQQIQAAEQKKNVIEFIVHGSNNENDSK